MAPLSPLRSPATCEVGPPDNNPAQLAVCAADPPLLPVLEVAVGFLLITRKTVGDRLMTGIHYMVFDEHVPVTPQQIVSGEWPAAHSHVLPDVQDLLQIGPKQPVVELAAELMSHRDAKTVAIRALKK